MKKRLALVFAFAAFAVPPATAARPAPHPVPGAPIILPFPVGGCPGPVVYC